MYVIRTEGMAEGMALVQKWNLGEGLVTSEYQVVGETCSCPRNKFKRECKHVDMVRAHLDPQPVPKATARVLTRQLLQELRASTRLLEAQCVGAEETDGQVDYVHVAVSMENDKVEGVYAHSYWVPYRGMQLKVTVVHLGRGVI